MNSRTNHFPARGNKRDFKVIVVGAGFGGIAAVIELKQHGFTDISVIEAANGIGGTWFYNDYPGSACDVPSHLYSYSFAQRAKWSRLCSPQAEILAYIKETADAYDVTRHVVTNTKVTACHWDDKAARWTVHTETNDGVSTQEADAVIIATGQLNQPAYPKLDGMSEFRGHSFHSARWDHDYDLRGKRVAVIGTGASAVQFVPEIAPAVKHLTVFQRTGNWILPRKHSPYPKAVTGLFEKAPVAREAWRGFLFRYMEWMTTMVRHPKTLGKLGKLQSGIFMRWQLRNPEVRKKAWPDYTYGCKRVLFSSAFLPALQRPNVDLVTDKIVKMTPSGPQTADGQIHQVDCIIYGTGFRTNDFMFPMDITGVGGRSLRDVWKGGAKAHVGITMSGFPSLFVMYGPNTNTSGGSIIYFLEAQAKYLRQALQLARQQEAAVDVRADVEESSTDEVQRRFGGTAWTACDSWYRDGTGRIIANWPGYMKEYAKQTERLNPAHYNLVRAKSARTKQQPVGAP